LLPIWCLAVAAPAVTDNQLPGSAHDLAVAGLGFRFDYIDPQYPTAAKVS